MKNTRVEMRIAAAEFRVVREENKPPRIVGYGARFNEVTTIGPFFREKIAPGAFAECLKTSDARALFNHDSNHVLGRQSAGTLNVFEDESGLRYEITPPDTRDARDLMVLLERGDVRESSFSFNIAEDGEEWDDAQTPPLRTITRVSSLFDVGPVTFPAYPTATAGVRSAEQIAAEHVETVTNHTKKSEARRALGELQMLVGVLEIEGGTK